MSEFTCKNGHIISPSVGYCQECGGSIYFMDGMSNRELQAREEETEDEKS